MIDLSRTAKALRIGRKLSQGDLAEKLGVSRANISQIENGRHFPSIKLIGRYKEFFGVDLYVEAARRGRAHKRR